MSVEPPKPITEQPTPAGLVTIRASDIEPQEIRWLWPGRIAIGKLTLIAGDPGLGKSLFTLDLAAHVSRGGVWPVDGGQSPLGDVLLVSAEDDAADTIVPRLVAAGGDPERVHILDCVKDYNVAGEPVERVLSLERDVELMARRLAEIEDCRLVVVDPISAYLGHVDTHRNSEVRSVLAPLSRLAQDAGAAFVLVSHLNKSKDAAAYRITGSIAFTAAVRASMLVVKDKDEPLRRLVLPAKNNLAPDDIGGLAYRVAQTAAGKPYLEFDPEAVLVSADDALDPENDDRAYAKNEAKDFLRELLKDGPADSKEAQKEAKEAGISSRTLDRARAELGVICRPAMSRGKWRWSLPTSPPVTSPTPSIPQNMANMANMEITTNTAKQSGEHETRVDRAVESKSAKFANSEGVGDSGELTKTFEAGKSLYPWPDKLAALLDQARTFTGYSIAEARERLSAEDLDDLLSGDLSIEAARHYLTHTTETRS